MNRIITAVVFMAVLTVGASAQILKSTDVTQPPAKVQGGGAVVPWLAFGLQATEALGYNLETKAAGMAYDITNPHPDVRTIAWFSIDLVDGVTGAPLAFATAEDSEDWKTTFTFKNFSARINTVNNLEMKRPMWTAEVRGQGMRFGLLSQAGRDIGTTASNDAVIALTGANQVTNLNVNSDAATGDFVLASDLTPTNVQFTGGSGMAYAGYEAKDLFKTFLTVFAEGNATSAMNVADSAKKQGWAWAWEGSATPLGQVSASNPLAVTVKADAIKGFGFTSNTVGNTGGLGLGTQLDLWLGEGMVLSPTGAFDLRLNDLKVSGHMADSEWQAGGGLMLQLGGAAFVNDDWNELSALKATHIANKIRKFTYLQVLGMYSDATDFDLAFKAEEPDGLVGLDPNLGAMVEYRLNNLRQLSTTTQWSATGRVSYDLEDHSVVPYLRFFSSGPDFLTLNKSSVLKLRAGVQLAVLPGFGLEAAYLTPQLLSGASTARDAGKLEVIATFKTEGEAKKVLTPKTMYFEDWNK